MRDLQAKMLAAVLDGGGLRGVAELAASEAGIPVAIVLPARSLSASAPDAKPSRAVAEYVAGRLNGDGGAPPAEIEAEQDVVAG